MATESTSALPNSSASLEPSKVLHLRNLPEEITEHDIRRIASDYGTVMRGSLSLRRMPYRTTDNLRNVHPTVVHRCTAS